MEPHEPARGFTLLEVVISSVIATVVAGGTMAAFVTAAQMTRAQSYSGTVEAVGYARESVERFRNLVACDAGSWYSGAGCTPTLPVGWQSHPLPGTAGTESLLATGMKRCYRATEQDCDGVGGTGDCVAVEVRVCWNNELSNCPC